jgi:transcription elongation factor GreA
MPGARRRKERSSLNVKEKLEAELKSLERELRIELPQEIKVALAMGDLRENAEYHAALERQSFVKARIGQLKTRLGEVSQIRVEEISRDRVGLGSLLTVLDLDEDKKLEYEIVLSDEADPASGKISITSPLGRGFTGHEVGEEVKIQVPSGLRTYEILSLKTIHERS